jgi:hypothetical protein
MQSFRASIADNFPAVDIRLRGPVTVDWQYLARCAVPRCRCAGVDVLPSDGSSYCQSDLTSTPPAAFCVPVRGNVTTGASVRVAAWRAGVESPAHERPAYRRTGVPAQRSTAQRSTDRQGATSVDADVHAGSGRLRWASVRLPPAWLPPWRYLVGSYCLRGRPHRQGVDIGISGFGHPR